MTQPLQKLQKHGNDRSIIIDRDLIEALGIDDDTTLRLEVHGQSLVITPANVGVGPERIKASIKKMRHRYGPMLKRLAE